MNAQFGIKERVAKEESVSGIFNCLSEHKVNGCLQIYDGSIEYFCYFYNGHLIYSTNTLLPFERLKRNLHRLSHKNKTLKNNIVQEIINNFCHHLHDREGRPTDYQCISYLYGQNYISNEEASLICARITYEVCESLFCLTDHFYSDFIKNNYKLNNFCIYKIYDFANSCQRRIKAWQTFKPHIYSSYQRPLFSFDSHSKNNLGLAENQAIFRLLKGLSFRQLAALTDKDELLIAKILYPSIVNNAIILKEPKPPFDRLPKIIDRELNTKESKSENSPINLENQTQTKEIDVVNKNWTIACLGKSIKTQYQINYFLDKKVFTVASFEAPGTALKKLINLSPDLILLDLDLEEMNNYELCNLLKQQSQFKEVPIIILGQQKGSIDRTKAKLAGADAYLTKPLNRSDLLAIIFQYVNCN
ncbi:MAG: response regulator [Xenococcaceae cyanobacterium]